MEILIAEDDPVIRRILKKLLSKWGHDVLVTTDGNQAWNVIKEGKRPCLALLDWMMPGIDGIELLKRIKEGPNASAEVVVITAYGSIPLAVEAMRCGATDFITKPFIDRDLKELVSKVEVKRRRSCESFDSTDEIDIAIAGVLIGESQEMCDVREMIKVCAGSDATVLINGETGTGKDLAASVIHKNSVRRSFPFVKVSCAFFPHPLCRRRLRGPWMSLR